MPGRDINMLLVEYMDGDAAMIEKTISGSDSLNCSIYRKKVLSNGLDPAMKSTFDVLLVNLDMVNPCNTGRDCIRALSREFHGTPIVVMTEQSSEDLGKTALKEGAVDYLLKQELNQRSLERTLRLSVENGRRIRTVNKSKRKIKRLFESVVDPVIVVDSEWNIRHCNEEVKKSFGHANEELVGKPFRVLFADNTSYKTCNNKILPDIHNSGCGQAEVTFQNKDGRAFPASIKVTCLAEDCGKARGFIIGVKDTSDQVRAVTDELTSLYNRRFLLQKMNVEFNSAKRYGHSFSISICDLDHFKQINDRFGHRAGDNVLSRFGHIMAEELRGENIVGRYGGDEFIILFPYTEAKRTRVPLERIRRRLSETVFHFKDGRSTTVAATFGVAQLKGRHNNAKDLFENVDRALYAAKKSGRNKINIV